MISLQLFLSLSFAILVVGFIGGAIIGGWSTARAYEEGERPTDGWEATGDQR